MRTLPPRASLLALALLAAPLAAQTMKFPEGGGWVSSATTIPMIWEGRPALLLVSRAFGSPRVHYDPQYPHTMQKTPVFTLRGVLASDSRACAPGSILRIINDDFAPHGPGYGILGTMPA